MIFKDLEIVKLTHDIPDSELKEGDMGTIVSVYSDGSVYDIEFMDEQGDTKELITLDSSDIISVKEKKSFSSKEAVGWLAYSAQQTLDLRGLVNKIYQTVGKTSVTVNVKSDNSGTVYAYSS